jgi:hypothetical protein
LDEEELEDKKDVILDLSYRTIGISRSDIAKWLDGDDLNNLQELENVAQPVKLWDLDDGSTTIEKLQAFSKYSQMGIVRRSSNNEFELTQQGEDILENRSRGFETMKHILPVSTLPIHYIADRILKVLDYFDGSSENAVRDINKSSWQAERIFHEEFESKIKNYSVVVGTLIILAGAAHYQYLPIGLQRTGLIFDIVGAIFVALGLFRGRKGIAIESEEFGGRFAGSIPLQPESVRATTTSTLDGVFGTILLVSGFTLQFIAITLNA